MSSFPIQAFLTRSRQGNFNSGTWKYRSLSSPLASCRLPSSSNQRLLHLVVDSLRLPYEVKGQKLRFFRSSFLSEYSAASQNFGLHMVQENPEEIYTYALEQDRWVLDRLTAGRYFFPELYEDRDTESSLKYQFLTCRRSCLKLGLRLATGHATFTSKALPRMTTRHQ